MAIAPGASPTGITLSAVSVSVSMGVTVSSPLLTTYAVDPSGAMATASGELPTGMGAPAVLVSVSMGVTVPSPWLAT